MKLSALVIDQSHRSKMIDTEISLDQVSDTEWSSEKHDAKSWSIGIRHLGEPFAGGPTEMHLTNFPALVLCMQGHLQSTGQDGNACRLATGEAIYIDGHALHHTTFGPGRAPVIMLNMILSETGSKTFK